MKNLVQLEQFITNHLGLWLLLIAVLLLLFINELFAKKHRAKALSPALVVELMNHDNAVVIDLRDPETFRAGHIINAIRATEDDFNQARMDKYKPKPLILVCAKGIQSVTLATKLRQQGFAEPMVLAGGIASWQEANLPLVK